MPLNKITTNDFTYQSFFVGLDVHKKSWSVTVRTCGIEVEHFTQTPDPLKLVQHLQERFRGAAFHSRPRRIEELFTLLSVRGS